MEKSKECCGHCKHADYVPYEDYMECELRNCEVEWEEHCEHYADWIN